MSKLLNFNDHIQIFGTTKMYAQASTKMPACSIGLEMSKIGFIFKTFIFEKRLHSFAWLKEMHF